jgi:hypothetical protein
MRRATLKRGDRALERLTKNTAMAVGNRVEPLDGFRARFDVELDIPPGAVPPGYAGYRLPWRLSRRARNWCGRKSCPGWLPAHKAGSFGDCLHLLAPQDRASATENEMSGRSLDQVSDALRVAAWKRGTNGFCAAQWNSLCRLRLSPRCERMRPNGRVAQ